MTAAQVQEFMRWFVDDFYPKIDWWRSWIGYHEDVKLYDKIEFEWGCAQGSETVYIVRHPRNPAMSVSASLVDEEGMDTSALIRLYWVRRMWGVK